jgi:hypothetical protein
MSDRAGNHLRIRARYALGLTRRQIGFNVRFLVPISDFLTLRAEVRGTVSVRS